MDLRPLPCCFLDGSPCIEFLVEGDDSGWSQAEADCSALDGCIAPRIFWGMTCDQWGCPSSGPTAIDVSCCDQLTGLCTVTSQHFCQASSQLAVCPADCDVGVVSQCEAFANELNVCCSSTGEFCLLTTFADCTTLEGEYRRGETECTETCLVGCRSPIDSFTPASGPEWGQKTYTLDLCYPAPMIRVRPPAAHNNPARRGRGVPMTAFEVRAVAQIQSAFNGVDPCARAYGVLARDENGRRRPYLCSQIDPNAPGSATYSQGYFSKALDDNGPILRGRRVRRAGVMTEPHREVQMYVKQMICGDIE